MLKVISVPALDSSVLTAREQQVGLWHKLSQQWGEEEEEEEEEEEMSNAEGYTHYTSYHSAQHAYGHTSPART